MMFAAGMIGAKERRECHGNSKNELWQRREALLFAILECLAAGRMDMQL